LGNKNSTLEKKETEEKKTKNPIPSDSSLGIMFKILGR
jgi:hypothetical protein